MTFSQKLVYLDAQASTPLCEEAAVSMRRYVECEGGAARLFGNPHSEAHAAGWRAAEEVEQARKDVANLLAVRPNEILFTSGATEANNTAIKGVLSLRRERDGRDGIVTLASEHKCVLEACKNAQRRLGARLTILPVERDGIVDLERVQKAIDDKTALLSVMTANNEIGVLQPLEELARIAHAKGAWMHTDAAQALGKTAFDGSQIDLASFSAHKSYGPIGIGALYIAHRRRIAFEPLLHGGGQEGGVRSGTLSPMLAAGFAAAARMLAQHGERDRKRLESQTRLFLKRLEEGGVDFQLNGSERPRLVGNLNIRFAGVSAEALLEKLSDLCFSTAAACGGEIQEGSHVLRAIGLPKTERAASVRIGLHRYLDDAEVAAAAEAFVEALQKGK